MTQVLFLTHGNLADGVMDTVEMIFGASDRLKSFKLEPNSDLQEYEEKVFEYIRSVNDDLIIFVDIFGGSPYNTAQKAINEFDGIYLVTGLNVPMVIEIMLQLENKTAEELSKIAYESGKQNIHLYDKNGPVQIEKQKASAYEVEKDNLDEAGEIVFTRIDFRLLHGQVATRWIPKVGPDTVLIVDDSLYEDKEMIEVYRSSAPKGINVYVVPTQVIAYAYQHHTLPAGRIMLLFRDLKQLDMALKKGLKLQEIQLGGIPKNKTNTMVHTAVSLSTDDVKILDQAVLEGSRVYIQILPDEKITTYNEAKAKLN